MGRNANASLSVTVAAQDKASPTLDAAADKFKDIAAAEAAANATMSDAHKKAAAQVSNTDKELQKLSKSTKQSGEMLTRAGGLVTHLGGELGGLGSAVGQATGLLGGMLQALSSGDGLGIAMTVATAAISAGAAAWKLYTAEATLAHDESQKLTQVLGDALVRTAKDGQTEVDKLTESIRELRGENTLGARLVEAMAGRERLFASIKTMSAEADGDVLRQSIARLEVMNRTIPLMEQQLQLATDQKTADEQAAAAQRARTKAQQEHNAALKDAIARLKENLDAQKTADQQDSAAQDARMAAGLKQLGEQTGTQLDNEMAADEARVASNNAMVDRVLNKRLEAIEVAEAAELATAMKIDAAYSSAMDGVSAGFQQLTGLITATNDEQRAQVIKTALTTIAAQTAQAAVTAIAANAGIPAPAGPILAAAAAAAITALIASVSSFKSGGIIGATQQALGDRDAVPIIGHKGELVVHKEGTDMLRKLLGVRGGGSMATGGVVAGGRGGGITIVNNFNQLVPDSVTNLRAAKNISQQFRRLDRLTGRAA